MQLSRSMPVRILLLITAVLFPSGASCQKPNVIKFSNQRNQPVLVRLHYKFATSSGNSDLKMLSYADRISGVFALKAGQNRTIAFAPDSHPNAKVEHVAVFGQVGTQGPRPVYGNLYRRMQPKPESHFYLLDQPDGQVFQTLKSGQVNGRWATWWGVYSSDKGLGGYPPKPGQQIRVIVPKNQAAVSVLDLVPGGFKDWGRAPHDTLTITRPGGAATQRPLLYFTTIKRFSVSDGYYLIR